MSSVSRARIGVNGMAIFGAFRRKPHERAGFALYQAAVAAARDPWFYTALNVPDTLDGRFDLIALHAALLIHRLKGDAPPGPDLAQAVFDAMFSDMDHNLREMGLDMGVGKRVRAMWEAFHGRALAYGAALDGDDRDALATAVARNVWRGATPSDDSVQALTAYVRRQFAALRRASLDELATGRAAFEGVFA
jgi:cytochrome b pre-mRNA-processing protein 3